MRVSSRTLALFAALASMAVLGYLAGHSRSATSGQSLHPAVGASVLLEYPPGWRPAGSAPEIPGMTISQRVAYAPGGDAARAGLLAGQLAGGEPSPLPGTFVARLSKLPNTQVVDLLETQAYRYSELTVPGFAAALTLYAIPNPGGRPTALACYATGGFSAYLRTCEQIVATLRLAGQTHSYNLTPVPGYARQVSGLIGGLERQRVALRDEMLSQASPAVVQRLAARLAEGFASASASLSLLEPSVAVGQAQVTLSGAILQARNAYAALAAAAQERSVSRYNGARAQVYQAEAQISSALETFALLGYGQT